MARRLPKKMWCTSFPYDGEAMPLPALEFEKPKHGELYPGARIGRVTIVWEKPAKKKVRR